MKAIERIRVFYNEGYQCEYDSWNEWNKSHDLLTRFVIDYIETNQDKGEIIEELCEEYPAIVGHGLLCLEKCNREAARETIRVLRHILDTVENIIRIDDVEEGKK